MGFVFFVAGIISELIGFGVATIAMSILPFILALDVVIPLVAITAMTATGIVAFQTRSKDVFKHITPLLIGSVIGVAIGMFFLNIIEKDVFSNILGIFLISYALYSMFMKKQLIPINNKFGILVGTLAGFFGSFINIHGPFIGIYSSASSSISKEEIKDMVATYIFITGIFTVTGHTLSGRVTAEIMKYVFLSLPFLILGLIVGTKFFKGIDSNFVRYGVYLFILTAGIVLFVSV